VTALRHQRARASDLIYDACFEAFNTELSASERHKSIARGAARAADDAGNAVTA